MSEYPANLLVNVEDICDGHDGLNRRLWILKRTNKRKDDWEHISPCQPHVTRLNRPNWIWSPKCIPKIEILNITRTWLMRHVSTTPASSLTTTLTGPLHIDNLYFTLMVRSTIIARASDALPLAASVDDEQVCFVYFQLYQQLDATCHFRY